MKGQVLLRHVARECVTGAPLEIAAQVGTRLYVLEKAVKCWARCRRVKGNRGVLGDVVFPAPFPNTACLQIDNAINDAKQPRIGVPFLSGIGDRRLSSGQCERSLDATPTLAAN